LRENPIIQNKALPVLTLVRDILSGADPNIVLYKVHHMKPVDIRHHIRLENISIFRTSEVFLFLLTGEDTVIDEILIVDLPEFFDTRYGDFFDFDH
jgi:hypothetical protein